MAKTKKKAKAKAAPIVLGETIRLQIGEVFVRETDQGLEIVKFLPDPKEPKGKVVETGVALIPADLLALLTE